jgi:hypothetical protein
MAISSPKTAPVHAGGLRARPADGRGPALVAAYGAILGAFLLAFAGDAEVGLVIGVCAVYLAVYLGVPAVMLRIPKGSPRHDFFEKGLDTWTGHVSEAALQMRPSPRP